MGIGKGAHQCQIGAEAPKHSSYGTGLGVSDFLTGPGFVGLICPVSPQNVSVLCPLTIFAMPMSLMYSFLPNALSYLQVGSLANKKTCAT